MNVKERLLRQSKFYMNVMERPLRPPTFYIVAFSPDGGRNFRSKPVACVINK
jgi:hypothetical protein